MKRSLQVIQITEPCHESWDHMSGSPDKRFCDSCQKHVHDLSKMSRKEAEDLINRPAGSVCVRMMRDEQGRVITLDSQPAVRTGGFRWVASLAMALLTVPLLAIGCRKKSEVMGKTGPTPAVELRPTLVGMIKAPEPVMGDIAPATQPTTQPVKMGEIGRVSVPLNESKSQ